MIDQQLLDYIKKELGMGVSKEEIKNILLSNGWQDNDIEEVFNFKEPSEEIIPNNIPRQSDVNPVSLSEQPLSSNLPETKLSEDVISTKSSKKPLKIIISIILALMLIGGSVFAYFYYFESPERIVAKMLENMSNVKSLEYKGQMAVEVETLTTSSISYFLEKADNSKEKQKESALLDLSGSFDINNLDSPKLVSSIKITSDVIEENTEASIIINDEVYYFKLTDIPNIFFDASFLEDKWVSVDLKEIKKYLEEEGKGEDVEEFEKQKKILLEEKTEQIKEITKKANVYIITKKSIDEINGKKAYRYAFTMSREKIIDLFSEINKLISDEPLIKDEDRQEVMEILKDVEMPSGEVWIGKEDLLLYKIKIDYTLENIEMETVADFDIDLEFSNHNKEIKVDIPSSTKTLEEIFAELMGASFGEATTKAADANIKLLLDQLKSQMEYLRVESSTSTYLSKPLSDTNIKKISDEISNLNKDHNFAIYSNGAKWCAKATLNAGSDWCVDSTGYIGEKQNCTNSSFSCR